MASCELNLNLRVQVFQSGFVNTESRYESRNGDDVKTNSGDGIQNDDGPKNTTHKQEKKLAPDASKSNNLPTKKEDENPENRKETKETCLLKELGYYEKPISYEDYKHVQQIIDHEYALYLIRTCKFSLELLQNDGKSYEMCLAKLLHASKQNQNKNIITKKYNEMPKFYTIGKLGAGEFGDAFLIVKSNDGDRFDYEMLKDSNRLNGKKNLYVFKKIPFPKDDDDKEDKIKFLTEQLRLEMKLGCVFNHPNICRFYGAYSSNFFCSFIHEYLCCGSVREIIQDDSLFQSDLELYKKRMFFYSSQLLLALEYLHERGVYHCDVKEVNICLDYQGYAKLIDFGNVIQDGQELPRNFGIYQTIIELHLKNKPDIENDERDFLKYLDKYYLNLKENKQFYEIDVFGFSIFLLHFYIKYKNVQNNKITILGEDFDLDDDDTDSNVILSISNEVEVFNVVSGLLETIGDIEVKRVPTVKELRQNYAYFKEMDFTKLLLRGYDLEKELKLDLVERFNKYSVLDTEESKLVFKKNEAEFCEKNDLNNLKQTHSEDSFTLFSKLSEHEL